MRCHIFNVLNQLCSKVRPNKTASFVSFYLILFILQSLVQHTSAVPSRLGTSRHNFSTIMIILLFFNLAAGRHRSKRRRKGRESVKKSIQIRRSDSSGVGVGVTTSNILIRSETAKKPRKSMKGRERRGNN